MVLHPGAYSTGRDFKEDVLGASLTRVAVPSLAGFGALFRSRVYRGGDEGPGDWTPAGFDVSVGGGDGARYLNGR